MKKTSMVLSLLFMSVCFSGCTSYSPGSRVVVVRRPPPRIRVARRHAARRRAYRREEIRRERLRQIRRRQIHRERYRHGY